MKFGLVRKLVLGISGVSIITFGTSAFFIFVLKPWLAPNMADWLYVSGVLALGVLWTSFLGWLAAQVIIRPLLRLAAVVDEAATGNLTVTIPHYRSNDEIMHLHRSFETMLGNLKQIIAELKDSVSVTDQSAGSLSSAIGHAAQQIETIAITIDRVAEGASTQAESAQTMFHTVERVTETASEVSRQAEHAIALSDAMVKTIAASGDTFRSLVGGMSDVSDRSEHTLTIVRKTLPSRRRTPGSTGSASPSWRAKSASWPRTAPKRGSKSTVSSGTCRSRQTASHAKRTIR
ncbi:MAG: methyl-accepting chemotaxis sensory transducer [Paenibacillus sp.]|nr:methyl-accepting chemotaxis sensory transducer [Paenibacillus sp.]